MASIPSSAPSKARVEGGVRPASHAAHADSDRYKHAVGGRQRASACPGSEGERENDDDALVPSLFKDTPSTSASAAAPAPAKSNWDAAFYSNTPTPKPPPRLAPMPRSPPPPLVIQTQLSSASPATPGHPAGQSPKPTSRYASAYHAHNRSVSQSQAHSNHGNNVFTHAAGGSPNLAALATSGAEQPPVGIIFRSGAGQRKIYPGLKNTIGPYKLLHSIGHGSFSEVKLSIDTRTGDHVAIKVVSQVMIQSSERLGISVRRESDLLKSIHHPNIIGFREVVETSLQMCIVLDYASGGELFEFVADKRAMASEQDMQYIFAQIVDAVDYLHQHNTVHRDLKLENVLLEPRKGAPLRPKVKLTDFGLAKVIEQEAPLLTTRCGSEDYAAPEIILGLPYDGREADIWSLGVLLYALLVGFLPFNMRPGMSRKSFLSVIAHAEFGFPGEKVVSKRTSLMKLHERSLSSASTGSSSSLSAPAPAAPAAITPAAPSRAAASCSNDGTLLPAAPVDAIATEGTAVAAFVVPMMRGVMLDTGELASKATKEDMHVNELLFGSTTQTGGRKTDTLIRVKETSAGLVSYVECGVNEHSPVQ
ncbi:NUAK SNF1-like kinase 1, partial [Mortierella alpina]